MRRACLPEVLLIEDVALALGIGESAARKSVVRGLCGPFIRLGRRLAVLRDSFLARLRQLETEPYINPAGKPKLDNELRTMLGAKLPRAARDTSGEAR